MQSSHATLVLILTALAAGQITYENGLALAIGANIGTTITAILGALSSNIEGKRLAAAHLIFNVITGVIAIIFIEQFRWSVEEISALVGIAADDYTLKLAVFHSLFNITGVLVMTPFIERLVVFLKRALPAARAAVARPKYLNDSTLGLPDTIMEVVRKETLHLWDNAFEIIAHGASLHRSDILSEEEMEEIVTRQKQVIEIDIDQKYEVTVKALYGAIVGFISRTQPNMTEEYAEELYAMRLAGRNIIEAVKDIKHLRKNLKAFVLSENEHIAQEYNRFQVQLGYILREISKLRMMSSVSENETLINLDRLRKEIDLGDVVTNGILDKLIRENKITVAMATSMMNDSTYVHEISSKLIDMGTALFAYQQGREGEPELDDD